MFDFPENNGQESTSIKCDYSFAITTSFSVTNCSTDVNDRQEQWSEIGFYDNPACAIFVNYDCARPE